MKLLFPFVVLFTLPAFAEDLCVPSSAVVCTIDYSSSNDWHENAHTNDWSCGVVLTTTIQSIETNNYAFITAKENLYPCIATEKVSTAAKEQALTRTRTLAESLLSAGVCKAIVDHTRP